MSLENRLKTKQPYKKGKQNIESLPLSCCASRPISLELSSHTTTTGFFITDFFTLSLASISASQTRVQVFQMDTESESRFEKRHAFYFDESQKSCVNARGLASLFLVNPSISQNDVSMTYTTFPFTASIGSHMKK
ncbi:hypothetical protein J6590_058413 [Homalodisca vitripennis]|nr:hypothetical protein J6590_058413 [Homalodisca vitripennis]